MKIYTKTGDDGTTGWLGPGRVRKDDARIEACGSVDEINAAIGVIIAHLPAAAQKARGWLDALQGDLFCVGAMLASTGSAATPAALTQARVESLEQSIDQMETDLPALKNFVLPQGTIAATLTHQARAIARRAERRVVALTAHDAVDPLVLAYLNRLADFLFVLARWVNQREGGTETAWIHAQTGVPIETVPAPDRLSATLQKLEADKEKRKTLFEKASSDLERKKREAEQAFRQNVNQIKKDGGKVDKPFREIDLD